MLCLNKHDVEVPLWEFLKNHGVVAVPPGRLCVHLPEAQGPVVAPEEDNEALDSSTSVCVQASSICPDPWHLFVLFPPSRPTAM